MNTQSVITVEHTCPPYTSVLVVKSGAINVRRLALQYRKDVGNIAYSSFGFDTDTYVPIEKGRESFIREISKLHEIYAKRDIAFKAVEDCINGNSYTYITELVDDPLLEITLKVQINDRSTSIF